MSWGQALLRKMRSVGEEIRKLEQAARDLEMEGNVEGMLALKRRAVAAATWSGAMTAEVSLFLDYVHVITRVLREF